MTEEEFAAWLTGVITAASPVWRVHQNVDQFEEAEGGGMEFHVLMPTPDGVGRFRVTVEDVTDI